MSQAYGIIIRQLPTGNNIGSVIPPYELSGNQEVVIGRDPSCQLILNSQLYTRVSRRHAAIRPVKASGWEICDLNSGNGTYVNGRRVYGCQVLYSGDRVTLGQNGPEFRIESQAANNSSQSSSASASRVGIDPDSAVSLTNLFPIFSTELDLRHKGFLIPGIITVLTVVTLIATLSANNASAFINILGAYLAGAGFYFVYQFCGKTKPWWLLVTCAVTTFIFVETPLFSLVSLVFGIPAYLITGLPISMAIDPAPGTSILAIFITFFFNAGLREELTKALPVFAIYLIGRRLSSPQRERIGVWEPLDGILLCAACSVGFTLNETLTEYVPRIIQQQGTAAGIALLIPRVLGEIAGHMAWSGYFGYFIGLSILKPKKAWQFLGIGYLSAAVLHTCWDSFAFSILLSVLIGILSYASLAAAILKARKLSPNRAHNFATRFFS